MKIDTRLGNLVLEFPEGIQVSSYTESNETIRLFDAAGKQITPSYVAVGLGYENESGSKHKVTSRIDADPKNISTNLQILLSQFDKLYAIDTNKKRINDLEVCISCRVEIGLDNISSKKWFMCMTRLTSFIFINPTVHEELIGWQEFIEAEASLHLTRKIGIVVDHDLGNIPLYNQRKNPYLGQCYLPNNISLIYANAGRDLNSPLNKAVQTCDADANLLISKLKNNSATLSKLSKSNNALYDSYFHWSPSIVQASK